MNFCVIFRVHNPFFSPQNCGIPRVFVDKNVRSYTNLLNITYGESVFVYLLQKF